MLTCALIVDEKEEAIAQEGSAKGTAKDAPVDYRHGAEVSRVGCVFVGPAVGIEIGVFDKPEGIAVELVGAALGDHDDLTAVGIAVLCGGIAGNDVDFAEGVDVGAVADVI